jgi:hypothetical protein
MPRMYNPDTQVTVDVDGADVGERKADGFVVVGNRPEAEYVGKTRDELLVDEPVVDEGTPEPGNPS